MIVIASYYNMQSGQSDLRKLTVEKFQNGAVQAVSILSTLGPNWALLSISIHDQQPLRLPIYSVTTYFGDGTQKVDCFEKSLGTAVNHAHSEFFRAGTVKVVIDKVA